MTTTPSSLSAVEAVVRFNKIAGTGLSKMAGPFLTFCCHLPSLSLLRAFPSRVNDLFAGLVCLRFLLLSPYSGYDTHTGFGVPRSGKIINKR